jgi:hypothetical protein
MHFPQTSMTGPAMWDSGWNMDSEDRLGISFYTVESNGDG